MSSTISLKPLVDSWSSAIEAAKEAKDPFSKTAEICEHFFCGSIGYMWESDFRKNYMGNMDAPKFQITIAKAFELVSIIGPTLFWQNPGRYVTGYDQLDIPPEIFGDPQDPNAAMAYQSWQQEYQQELAIQKTRNALMQHYLNYSQREQPGGGLKTESQMAIIDALVKGRGVLRVDAYQPSGMDDYLTGSFYVNVDDLYIDPNCTRSNLSNAKWIAIKHVEPHWEVERRFGWKAGSLKGKSTMATKDGAERAKSHFENGSFRTNDKVEDLVTWYEIFSKCGVGTRFNDRPSRQWHNAFEEARGDFAYLCIIPGMNEVLNAPQSFLANASMEQVEAALDWPIPYYKDGRWPVALLDFWMVPRKPWPLAPLAMGLGELTCLNVFISSLTDRVYQDGLSKFAIRKETAVDAVEKLKSYRHEVIELNTEIAGHINDLISFVQRPPINFDYFRVIDWLSQSFDKRVGLMELLYGLNPGGKVTRTAADASIKGEAVSVRPEFMAMQVEAWQTEVANLERIAAGDSVAPQTTIPLFGTAGAGLWDQLITRADPVVYLREMRSRVEANSLRKPNKSRDNQNLQQMSGYMLPMLQWYAGSTGNTDPLNNYLSLMGKAMDQEMDGLFMPPIQPPQPDPAQQEAAEMERAIKQAELEGKELKNEKTAHDMIASGAALPPEMVGQIETDPTFSGQV